MTDNLPPLPAAFATLHHDDGYFTMPRRDDNMGKVLRTNAYTTEQMQAYARAALPQAQRCVPADDNWLKSACRIHTSFAVGRYLMSCADGREDGAEKALRHIQLCSFYVAMFHGHPDPDTVRREHEDDYQLVHTATQALTDYLDEAIGFPLKGRPDYDTLVPLFFERFHALAMGALAASPKPQPVQPSEASRAAVPADPRAVIELCRKALAEELSAWDIDPPLHHVNEAHKACVAWLSNQQTQADGLQPLDVLTSVWNAMQNSADGDDLLNKLEHMRDSINRAVDGHEAPSLIKSKHTEVTESGTEITRLELTDDAKRMLSANVSHIPSAAPQPVAQPGNEAAFLRSQIALAREEMSCANFNSAAERLRHCAEVTQAKPEQAAQQWQPIETAPKDGRTLLLGYFNSHNNWRTMRGQWMSEDYISEYWDDPEGVEPGWFETVVEADEPPNCWPTEPTHWMPLPAAPKPKD